MSLLPTVKKGPVEVRPMMEQEPAMNTQDTWVPSPLERAGSTFKALTTMARRPPINITFQDLTYSVRSTNGSQTILSGLSGKFHSGELTAILGPSGAGKSTLMNVLVGYTTAGVMGSIQINDHPREMKFFKKLSTYIMQDDLIQPRLTVHESMLVAANLKLGDELGSDEKVLIVEEILQTLGLWACRDTRVENISGGQRKRLSIALELVNNPPVLFLDEPTTGLDVVSVKKCIALLKLLARQGRTVVTTLHQPSASHLFLLDNVYFVADGKCCFQGSPQKLVPFLSRCGLNCPTTHNPADFMMEALQSDSCSINLLSKTIENGRLKEEEKIIVRKGKPKLHSDMSCKTMYATELRKDAEKGVEFATSFWKQFIILSKRMFLQSRRNSIALWIQLMHHVISAVLLGGIFFGIGNNGAIPIDNFKFCISILVFFMYTYVMIPVLLFPMEVGLLRREYFNRWYSLKSYYAALTFASLPTIVLLGFIFLTIAYVLSGQLMEFDRFLLFSTIAILTGLCSEGLGLTVGSTFSVTNGSIIGPAAVAPLLALCVYGMGYGPAIEPVMKVLMAMSYLRYGAVGLATALYDNRGLMDCDVEKYLYCHYRDPQMLLRDLGMQTSLYSVQVLALIAFTLLYRFAAYLALRYRLTTEFSNKILNYIAKTTRHR